MTSALLDTSIVVACLRGKFDLFSRSQDEQLFVSLISVGELMKGVFKSSRPEQQRAEIDRILRRVAILHLSEDTAELYARTSFRLQAQGRPIPENDVWIAAAALEVDLPLATFDAHFEEVEGLRLHRW